MKHALSDSLLIRFSGFVAAQMGLHFPAERWSDLQRGIHAAAREFNFAEDEACLEWLMSAPLTRQQIEILASNLTVGETYFFREKRSFEVLGEQILPELIRSRRSGERRLRLWSAACCTGEEPYSLAILLSRTIPDLRDWNVSILASDINPRFLQKAAAGVFGEWSFRDSPAWLKEGYFKRTPDGRFEISPVIKKMVAFTHLNLVEDVYPSLLNDTNAMDVIFCRNVLMYFTPGQAGKVIQNLNHSLVEGGWLFVSPSESSHVLFPQFTAAIFPGAILYRKDSQRLPSAVIHAPAAEPETPAFFNLPTESTPEPAAPMESLPPPEFKLPAAGAPLASVAIDNGRLLYDQGRYAEAAAALVTLCASQQPSPETLALLARALANQGGLESALIWCDKAVAADKLNAASHYLRATILQEQGALDDAIRSFQRALYLDQKFVLAHFALGNLRRQQARFAEADKHFQNARHLLDGYRCEDILPESEGITAGRLAEIIEALTESEVLK